jgi:hypothetical protein
VPNYDVIVYHDFDSREVSVQVGDSAKKLGNIFRDDEFVSGIYPPLHEGKDATVVISGGGDRPVRGLEQVLDR